MNNDSLIFQLTENFENHQNMDINCLFVFTPEQKSNQPDKWSHLCVQLL